MIPMTIGILGNRLRSRHCERIVTKKRNKKNVERFLSDLIVDNDEGIGKYKMFYV